MASQTQDLEVTFVQKIYFENIVGHVPDVWDVHTDKDRWWVMTNPMNLLLAIAARASARPVDIKSYGTVAHSAILIRAVGEWINKRNTEGFEITDVARDDG